MVTKLIAMAKVRHCAISLVRQTYLCIYSRKLPHLLHYIPRVNPKGAMAKVMHCALSLVRQPYL